MDPTDNETVSVQRVCAGISSVEIDKVFPNISSVSCRDVEGDRDAEAEDVATDTVSHRDIVILSGVATVGVDVFHEPVPVEATVTADKGAVSCRIRDQQSTPETVSCRDSGRHSGCQAVSCCEVNAGSVQDTVSCREYSGRQAASGCKVKCGVGYANSF